MLLPHHCIVGGMQDGFFFLWSAHSFFLLVLLCTLTRSKGTTMPPLRVEYAKSSRSRCTVKECNKFIEKGEARIGTAVMMPGMDTPSFKWRHLCCFTARQAKNAGSSVDNIEGFEDLLPADQNLVVKMMRGELVGDVTILGKTGTAGTHIPDEKGPVKTKGATGEGKKKEAPKKRARPAAADDADGAASDATDDYDVEDAGIETVQLVKPQCPYGAACFRKNPDHFAEFAHGETVVVGTSTHTLVTTKKRDTPAPPKTDVVIPAPAAAPVSSPPVAVTAGTTGKKKCPHGDLCFRTDGKHFAEFEH